MSLVGTRPILQDELRQYELHHRARIAIKPGITGMWQVSGRSDITDFEEVGKDCYVVCAGCSQGCKTDLRFAAGLHKERNAKGTGRRYGDEVSAEGTYSQDQ